jgi:hypothetical protein
MSSIEAFKMIENKYPNKCVEKNINLQTFLYKNASFSYELYNLWWEDNYCDYHLRCPAGY